MTTNPLPGASARLVDWLNYARQFLADTAARRFTVGLSISEENGSEANPSLEAQVLLAHVLAKPRAWLLAHPETHLELDQQKRFESLLDRLANGEPLPYLIGHWEFYGMDFWVTPAVLIPRPETELLVEHAVTWLNHHTARRRAADVGTGSGCIAISIARQIPGLQLLAVDRSRDALQVARENARRLTPSAALTFIQSDLLTAVSRPLDLVCANLPYIPHDMLSHLPVANYEPRLALDGGSDGLQSIHGLLEDAPHWLAPRGLILLEMQYDQGQAVQHLAEHYLPGAKVTVHADLAGLPRLVKIENRD